MSKYINLDDPDVTYSHNAGNHEVYIVGTEAERIDIVRCKDCLYYKNGHVCLEMSKFGTVETKPMDYCSHGVRR